MGKCLILSLVVLLQNMSVLSKQQNCSLELQSDLSFDVRCRYGIKDCSQQSLSEEFPAYFTQSSWGHDVPTDLRAASFCRKFQAGINLGWKLPQHSGAASITGFVISVNHNVNDYRCVVIFFKENVTMDKMTSTFSGTIYPMMSGVPYTLLLYSLPRSNSSKHSTITKGVKNCDNPMASSKWTPSKVSYVYNSTSRDLTIEFEAPPEDFRFNEFKLTLLSATNISKVSINVTNGSPQHKHTFRNIFPDTYDLRIEPVDSFPFDLKRCLCQQNKRCTSCSQLKKTLVLEEGPGSTQEPLQALKVEPQPEESVTGPVIMAACGVLVVLGMIPVLLLLFRRYRRNKDGQSDKAERTKGEPVKPAMCIVTEGDPICSISKTRLETFHFLLEKELDTKVTLRKVNRLDNLQVVVEKFCSLHTIQKSTDEVTEDRTALNARKPVFFCCVVAADQDLELAKIINIEDKFNHLNFVNFLLTVGHDFKPTVAGNSHFRQFEIETESTAFVQYVKDFLKIDLNVSLPNRRSEEDIDHENASSGHSIYTGMNDKPTSQRIKVPSTKRGRFISYDSGKGSSPEDYCYPINAENFRANIAPYAEACHHSMNLENFHANRHTAPFLGSNDRVFLSMHPGTTKRSGERIAYYKSHTGKYRIGEEGFGSSIQPPDIENLSRCPSGYFIPPDPSITSDIDSQDIQLSSLTGRVRMSSQVDDVNNMCAHRKHLDEDASDSNDQSLDDMMDRFAEINMKNGFMQKYNRPDDTCIVCEDFV